jgi:hypothetical protein
VAPSLSFSERMVVKDGQMEANSTIFLKGNYLGFAQSAKSNFDLTSDNF